MNFFLERFLFIYLFLVEYFISLTYEKTGEIIILEKYRILKCVKKDYLNLI